MSEHNACGTPDCCGACPTADDTSAVDRIYRRLDGGAFGRTSKDCIRAVLHASQDTQSVDEAETVDTYVPAGAAAMWDHIAGTSPQYIPPWVDQSEHSRSVFIRAFSIGLETLAHGAADA